jgi:para-nitrobenzyl esterase
MMASPRAKGLFHRAILHSGGRVGPGVKSLAEAEREGAELTGARSAAKLRALAPAALQYPAPPGFWGPIVDGHVLEAGVEEVFARGGQNDVPLLAGYTRDEGTPYPTPELHSREAFLAHACREYGGDAENFLRLFPAKDDAEALASSYALRRDSYFAYQPWKVARLHAQRSVSPVYLFNFLRAVPLPHGTRFREPEPPGGYGAYHGAELWYTFDTLSAKPWPWQPADRSIAAAMSSAWVAFARTGTLPGWPKFRETGLAMHLDERSYAAPPFNAAALAFLDHRMDRKVS